MKYIKKFENKSELEERYTELHYIIRKLEKYAIVNYNINDDNTIDVDGDVNLSHKLLTKIPFKFGKVTGSFFCHANKITSLEGSPYYVGINFSCYENKLETLKGSPVEVGKKFDCTHNNLLSLEGMPLEIGEDFDTYANPNLKELDSISNIDGDIYCSYFIDITKFRGYCKNIYKIE